MLLVAVWTVAGGNTWQQVYGLPAICAYRNLGQGGGRRYATIALAIFDWFLLRSWAYALLILLPSFRKLHWTLSLMSGRFWAFLICDALQTVSKKSAAQLHHKTQTLDKHVYIWRTFMNPKISRILRKVYDRSSQVLLTLLYGVSLLGFGIIHGISQVWISFAFIMCWNTYSLYQFIQIMAVYRARASYHGMIGNENQWGFGQQLPILMLALPLFALAEMFFDDTEEEPPGSIEPPEAGKPTVITSSSLSGAYPSSSQNFHETTGGDSAVPPNHMLRRRVDTEEQIGMDISDSRATSSSHSWDAIITSSSSSRSWLVTELNTPVRAQLSGALFSSTRLLRFVESDTLRDDLWDNVFFKLYVFAVFVALFFLIVWYGF